MKGNPKKAFTLIELLIVVSIISIIMLIATPNYVRYKKYAKEEKAVNIGRQICLEVINTTFEGSNLQLANMKSYIEEDMGVMVESVSDGTTKVGEKITPDKALEVNAVLNPSVSLNSDETSNLHKFVIVIYITDGIKYKCSINMTTGKCGVSKVDGVDGQKALLYKNY